MTPEAFNAWLAHMGQLRGKSRPISDSEASRLLGWSRMAVIRAKQKGAPQYIGLACAAITFGLPEWSSPVSQPEPPVQSA